MNIIAFELCPTTSAGGSERSFFDVLTGLREKGHHVRLFYNHAGDLVNEYELAGINTREVKVPFMMRSGSKLIDLWSMVRFARSLTHTKSNTIIYLNFTEALPLAALIKLFCGYSIVCHIRLGYYGLSKQIRLSGRFIDRCITINQKFKAVFEKVFNIQGKVLVIYNGIAIPSVLPPVSKSSTGKDLRILYLGRVAPEKGIVQLVAAFSNAVQKGMRASLQITGDYIMSHSGDYRRELADAIVDSGLEERITISSPVPDPVEYIADFDLFIFPSVWEEPFGRTIPESILAGTPVLARNVGMIREIMSDNLHFVFDTDEELSEKLLQFANGKLKFDLVNARIRMITQFSKDRMINEVEGVLRLVNDKA